MAKHMLRVVWPLDRDPSPVDRQMLTFKCVKCRWGLLHIPRMSVREMLTDHVTMPSTAGPALRAWGKCKEDGIR